MFLFLYIALISIYFLFSYVFYKRVFLKNILFMKKIFPEIKEKNLTLKLFPKVGLLLTLLLPSKMILNVGWKDKNIAAWYIYLIILSFLFWFCLLSCNGYLIMIAYFYLTLHIEIFIFSYLYHRSSFFNAKMILFLGAEISLDKIVRFYLGNPWDAAKQSAIFAAGSFTFMVELIREHMVADQMADAHMQSYKHIADNDLLEAKSIVDNDLLEAKSNIKTNLDKRIAFLEAQHQIDSLKLDKAYPIAEKALAENMEAKTVQALAEINRQKMELNFALVDKSLEANQAAAKATIEANQAAAKAAIEERFSYRDQALRSQLLYHALSSTKVAGNVNFEYRSSKP